MNTGASRGSALGADGSPPQDHPRFRSRSRSRSPTRSSAIPAACSPVAARPRPNGPPVSTWAAANTRGQVALFDRLEAGTLPDGWTDALPSWGARRQGPSPPVRRPGRCSRLSVGAAGTVGRSADLIGSNNTTIDGAKSFRPGVDLDVHVDPPTVRPHPAFGIRRHAMGSILSASSCADRPAYGGTFLQFADMRPAVASGGPDGDRSDGTCGHMTRSVSARTVPHQPVEHLAALRAIPHLDVVRPADANETRVRVGAHPDSPQQSGRLA